MFAQIFRRRPVEFNSNTVTPQKSRIQIPDAFRLVIIIKSKRYYFFFPYIYKSSRYLSTNIFTRFLFLCVTSISPLELITRSPISRKHSI